MSSWLGSGLESVGFRNPGSGAGSGGGAMAVVEAAAAEMECAFTLGAGVPVVPNTAVLLPVPGASGAVDVALHVPSAVAKQLLLDVNGSDDI